MKVYLAGTGQGWEDLCFNEEMYAPFVLGSYYYMTDRGGGIDTSWKLDYARTDHCRSFMVDSGAFTIFEGADKSSSDVDWNEYVSEYAEFINTHTEHVDHFFELDIDPIVGHARVRSLRDQLERETGRSCVPVWHKSRGKDVFVDLCQDYDYVAIGGIASGEITRSEYKYLTWFIKTAHNHDTRIHGLGFTPAALNKYRFDSVDSSSWDSGRFGTIYHFDIASSELTSETLFTDDRRDQPPAWQNIARHNLREWIKYARYMDGRNELQETHRAKNS